MGAPSGFTGRIWLSVGDCVPTMPASGPSGRTGVIRLATGDCVPVMPSSGPSARTGIIRLREAGEEPEMDLRSQKIGLTLAMVWPVPPYVPTWGNTQYIYPASGPYPVDWTPDGDPNGFTVTDQTGFGSWPYLAVTVDAYVPPYFGDDIAPPGDVSLLRNGDPVASGPLVRDVLYGFSAHFSWYDMVDAGDLFAIQFPEGPNPDHSPYDQPMISFQPGITVNYGFSYWMAERLYKAGDTVLPWIANGFAYMAYNAGTSGTSEPAWPLEGGVLVDDGEVQWYRVDGP